MHVENPPVRISPRNDVKHVGYCITVVANVNEKNWKQHRKMCKQMDQPGAWPPKDAQNVKVDEIASVVAQMTDKRELVLDVVEYALPQIQSTWKTEEKANGPVSGCRDPSLFEFVYN